uniref:Putative secreted peptide n=1 Tax=Rhipicephalus pulchellus TaxID=72859 RepID=L7MAL9_RHIPC
MLPLCFSIFIRGFACVTPSALAFFFFFGNDIKLSSSRCSKNKRTLKNTRRSEFPEPSTTASLIIASWFWDVKPQQLL